MSALIETLLGLASPLLLAAPKKKAAKKTAKKAAPKRKVAKKTVKRVVRKKMPEKPYVPPAPPEMETPSESSVPSLPPNP